MREVFSNVSVESEVTSYFKRFVGFSLEPKVVSINGGVILIVREFGIDTKSVVR